jgi:hypothetical protein
MLRAYPIMEVFYFGRLLALLANIELG